MLIKTMFGCKDEGNPSQACISSKYRQLCDAARTAARPILKKFQISLV